MTNKTKRRWAKTLLFFVMFFIFGFSTFAQLISPLLGTSKASAASSYNYVFSTGFSPNDQDKLKTFKDAIKSNDENNGIFSNTYVGVKGGVFKNKAIKLNYDKNKTSCAQAGTSPIAMTCKGFSGDHFGGQDKTLYVYSTEYMCRNNKVITSVPDKAYYLIRYSVSLNLGGSDGAFNGDALKNNTRLHWVGFGSSNTGGVRVFGDTKPNTIRAEKDLSINRIPKGCLPPDVPSAVSDLSDKNSEEKNEGIINKFIPILERASDSIKKSWKNAGLSPSTSTGSGSSSGSEAGEVDSACTYNANPLTWVVCPVIDGFEQFVNGLDKMITSLLSVGSPGNSDNPSNIFCDKTSGDIDECDAYHTAWASFRNIALGLLLIVGLVVIISEMADLEIFSAYTLKKMIPRLVAVAILMTLSWQLMDFFVQLSNSLGYAVRYLIYQPFVTAGFESMRISGLGSLTLALSSIALFGGLGPFGVLSFALTAAIGVLVAFLVLMIREMVIILLVIIAPIAIILYVLPNTERWFKMWWETFSKALLMFPMIAGMIAVGHVFSALVTQDGENNPFKQILGFAAYFGPYFMIPMTFKYSGAAMSAIGGAIDSRADGMRQGLSNYRSNKRKERFANAGERIKSGNTFKRAPEGSLRSRMNRGISAAANSGEAGFNPRHWRSNVRTAMEDASTLNADKFGQENEAFQAIDGDDALLHASRFYNREQIMQELANRDGGRFGGEENRARREDAANRIMRAQQQTDNATFQKARLIGQSKTGTGYQDANGNFDAAAMMEDINSVYGDDRNGAGSAIAKMRGHLQQSGQIAGAAGFGSWAEAADGLHNGTLRRRQAHNSVMDDAIDSATPMQQLYGKPSSARAMAQAHALRIQTIGHAVQRGDATQDQLDAAIASAAAVHHAMSQASPGNASEFASELMGQSVGTSLVRADGTTISGASGDNGFGEIIYTGATVKDFVDAGTSGQLGSEFSNRFGTRSSELLSAADRDRATSGGVPGAPLPPI